MGQACASGDTEVLRLAYLSPELGGLTSTFVYREIEALRKRGLEVATFSVHRPSGSFSSDEAKALVEQTTYLYAAPRADILRAVFACAAAGPSRFFPIFAQALGDALTARVSTAADRPKLLWHFAVGCFLARALIRERAKHLHAHFAHVPASIAMYGAGLAGITFSFTAHANDIFERPTALREKVRRAAFAVCISEYNRGYLVERGCEGAALHVVHCGLDLQAHPWRAPEKPKGPARILAIGRLVEKKGFATLIQALAFLKAGDHAFACDIVGNGPLQTALAELIEQAGLQGECRLLGGLPQERVRDLLSEADMVVLPCVVAVSGDRDGIPVVLMEAMAKGVPVVSTPVSGIPELIRHDETGLLAKPKNPESLAQEMARLLASPDLAARLATNARAAIEREFSIERSAAHLEQLFRGAASSPRAPERS